MWFGRRVDRELRNKVAGIMRVEVVDNFGKYLGLPSSVGRNKNNVFQYVKDRIWKKLQGRKGPLFSSAGSDEVDGHVSSNNERNKGDELLMSWSKKEAEVTPLSPDFGITCQQYIDRVRKERQQNLSDSKIIMVELPTKSLKNYSQPTPSGVPTGLTMPTIEATNFEIKPALRTMIQHNQFVGLPSEDPTLHLQRFQQLCSTIKHQGVTADQLKVMLFGFSIRDKAQKWLNDINVTE
ncbi:hypothetical protein AgCh_005502 [Apium graveolens]